MSIGKFYNSISSDKNNDSYCSLWVSSSSWSSSSCSLSGTGKTMLMDLFHSCVVTPRKKRVHFNTFMLDIHKSQYHVTGSFYFILYIFFFLCCPDVPPEIVLHYPCRWSRCFILYCFQSRVCWCRCSLTHAWHLCTAHRDPPEETKPSKTNAGETVHLWPHSTGCRGDKQWILPALLWWVSGEQAYHLWDFFSS